MTEEGCEKARISAMAVADGLKPELSADEIEKHIAECDECRGAVERMQAMMFLLDSQKRRELPVNLWPRVERRLDEVGKQSQSGWRAFFLASLFLLGCKIIELAMERDPGLVFKLAPVIIAIAVFAYLKENPFKIKIDLKLEGE